MKRAYGLMALVAALLIGLLGACEKETERVVLVVHPLDVPAGTATALRACPSP